KDATELSLTEMMVGEKVALDIGRQEPHDIKKRLEIQDLTCVDKNGVTTLDGVTFDAYGGEVLGIAGIAGSGQKELLEAIAGLQKVEKGSIEYFGDDDKAVELVGKTPLEIRQVGVALSFVPEDRLGMGLVANMDLADNVMLRSYRDGRGSFLNRKAPRDKTEQIVDELKVVTPGISTPRRKLSGGNVQKVLVGREISNAPSVLMTAYAVRGLDINTSYTIYHLINEQKEKGTAVIYVGEDLDVLLELADRIVVLCAGKVSGVVVARKTTKEQIGLMMTKHTGEGM
ncbi:MAG: ATP-binding cassette domain-containing protein, partial [Clostridia bacterium]|nr:ATP-binding cassette domain-containing protein [Clostridia bacterium]